MDKNYIYDNKLTPSAKEALEETMLEFQDLLLSKANSIAQKGQTADKEISLRDILEAKESLFKAKLEKEKAEYRRKRMMMLISSTGALYSVIGIFIYIYQNKDFTIEKNLGLIITFVGIITAIMGFFYSFLFTKRYDAIQKVDSEYQNDNDFDIIKKWQIIEKLGSNLMRQRGYSTNESKSINDILKFLSMELKSDKLYLEMRELLSIRNRILHEEYNLSRNEKQLYLNKAEKIIKLLENIEK